MLSKNLRLSSPNSVRRSSRYGKQVKFAEISLRYIDNKFSRPRLAVVVSKKVHKSAVKRNLIKRRIIEVYRQNIFNKLNSKNQDLVIFAHNKNILKKSPQQLTIDLLGLFNKADLL